LYSPCDKDRVRLIEIKFKSILRKIKNSLPEYSLKDSESGIDYECDENSMKMIEEVFNWTTNKAVSVDKFNKMQEDLQNSKNSVNMIYNNYFKFSNYERYYD